MLKKVFNKLSLIRKDFFVKKNKQFLKKNDIICLSFGENCLTDHILNRYGLKSFTTPFSHGRSNIEYILNLENDSYRDFTNLDFLAYEEVNDKQMPRHQKYRKIKNSYNPAHEKGFEFTHHDIISDENNRIKIQQRVDKLKKGYSDKSLYIFYHNRLGGNTDISNLYDDLNRLRNYYKNFKNVEVILFRQKLIDDTNKRRIEYSLKKNIHEYIFYTLNSWGGANPKHLWAYVDDDLIKKMIVSLKRLLKKNKLT